MKPDSTQRMLLLQSFIARSKSSVGDTRRDVVIDSSADVCLSQDWEYLLSSDHHRYFSTNHDCLLGFQPSNPVPAVLATGNLPSTLDVDTTAPLFPHIAAILSSLHLVYEVLLLVSTHLTRQDSCKVAVTQGLLSVVVSYCKECLLSQ